MVFDRKYQTKLHIMDLIYFPITLESIMLQYITLGSGNRKSTYINN